VWKQNLNLVSAPLVGAVCTPTQILAVISGRDTEGKSPAGIVT
jgi:hypothetical protein